MPPAIQVGGTAVSTLTTTVWFICTPNWAIGKTLLAERLPTILPDLADDDALTVTAIRSVANAAR